jgi:hypothetical protein
MTPQCSKFYSLQSQTYCRHHPLKIPVPKHQPMKMYVGVEAKFHTLLTLALDGGEGSAVIWCKITSCKYFSRHLTVSTVWFCSDRP